MGMVPRLYPDMKDVRKVVWRHFQVVDHDRRMILVTNGVRPAKTDWAAEKDRSPVIGNRPFPESSLDDGSPFGIELSRSRLVKTILATGSRTTPIHKPAPPPLHELP